MIRRTTLVLTTAAMALLAFAGPASASGPIPDPICTPVVANGSICLHVFNGANPEDASASYDSGSPDSGSDTP